LCGSITLLSVLTTETVV